MRRDGGAKFLWSQPSIHLAWRIDRARQAMLRRRLAACGADVTLDEGVVLHNPEQINVADHVYVGANTWIGGGGGVTIGSHVLIAANCSITSTSHPKDLERRAHGELTNAPVVLEDHVWLGTHAVILPGVRVGRGAIVGAGTVVTHDVPAGVTVVGVPARTLQRPQGDHSLALGTV